MRQDSSESCFDFVFFDFECLEPPCGEGEHLRYFLGGEIDLKFNSDDAGGETLLGGVEVELESFLTYMEDVSLLLAEDDLKASSSESEYLISHSGNGACLGVFW